MSKTIDEKKAAFEAKQAAKKDRLLDAAQRATTASNAAYNRVHEIGSMIPFGQPILVGHHSERRHRRDIERMNRLRSAFLDESEKAEHYARRAANVGKGGISSDDPSAIEKLRAQLVTLEATQEHMKVCNKLVKKNDRAGLAALLGSEDAAAKMFTKDFAGRVGFPSYTLTNNNANIRRITERIAALEARSKREDVEEVCEGYTYREDTEENRVMFSFDRKPPEEVRAVLKSHGFKWSPMRGAWVRQLNNAGINAAKHVKERLGQV
jgi:hypothetical protein